MDLQALLCVELVRVGGGLLQTLANHGVELLLQLVVLGLAFYLGLCALFLLGV